MREGYRLHWLLTFAVILVLCIFYNSQRLTLPATSSNQVHVNSVKQNKQSCIESSIGTTQKDQTTQIRHKKGLHENAFAFFGVIHKRGVYYDFILHFHQVAEEIVRHSIIPFFLRGPPNR